MDHQSESPVKLVELSDEARIRLIDAIYDAGRKVMVGDIDCVYKSFC